MGERYKIAINFPKEIYDKIKRRADKAKISVSEQAVDLVKCGLLDIEESEQHDPKPYNSRSRFNPKVHVSE